VETSHSTIGTIDIVIIVSYLILIVGWGSWIGLKKRGQSSGKSYFLASGSLSWPIIGLALFSTNISTIHLVSLAQEGYKNGLAYGNFEWMASFILIVLSLFFAPFYIRSRVTTLPDFLEKRYNSKCRDWLAYLSIVSAIFIHIGFSLYAGAVVLEGIFGIRQEFFEFVILGFQFSISVRLIIIIAIACATGLYTIIGGLISVVLTESVQTVILLFGAICITIIGLNQIGGWQGIAANVEPVKLTILRSADDASNLPWYSVFLGIPVIGLWYWCADQTIVQRVLGARSEKDARIGPLFAGFIKILPVFIFVLPGTICLALINKGAIPPLVETMNGADTYSHLIKNLLPVGLKGLVAAALLAALMGTVSGSLNSIATLFSYDVYKRWRPDTSQKKLVSVGRIVTFVAMIIAIFWSPLLAHYKSIFQGVNIVISYIAPPITVVFVFGVFWRRSSSVGALAALYIGSFLGVIVFFVDWFKDALWMKWLNYNIPFLMMAFYLFVVCSIILIFGSLISPHKHNEESIKLVWKNPLQALQSQSGNKIDSSVLLAGLLFCVMVILYVVFG
jgi:solute:Na+ symporter, SSS family